MSSPPENEVDIGASNATRDATPASETHSKLSDSERPEALPDDDSAAATPAPEPKEATPTSQLRSQRPDSEHPQSPADVDVDADLAAATPAPEARDVTPASQLRSQRSDSERPQSLADVDPDADPDDDADSAAATPAAEANFPVQCVICEEEFQVDENNGLSPAEALRDHMSSAHPNVAKSLDQETNGEFIVPPTSLDEAAGLQQVTNAWEESLMDRLTHFWGVLDTELEDRLKQFWEVHNVDNFTDDYDGDESGIATLWASKFDGSERPRAYEKKSTVPGEFLPLTDPDVLIDTLKNPDSQKTEDLYARVANVSQTLKAWQDEYLANDKLKLRFPPYSKRETDIFKRKVPKADKFEDPVVFEDKRTAMLYGYKYDPDAVKFDKNDPFLRRGFAPNSSQLKILHEEAKRRGTRNIDGWEPIIKNGEEYIPMIGAAPSREAKKAPTNARANKTAKEPTDEIIEESVEEADAFTGSPANENEGPKPVTRYGGSKHPATRETSVVGTAPSSPAPVRGKSTRGRRGRGPRVASSTRGRGSRAPTGTPRNATPAQAPTSVPVSSSFMPPPTRGRGRGSTRPTTPARAASFTPAAGPSTTGAGLSQYDDSAEYDGPSEPSNTNYDWVLQLPKNQEKMRTSRNPKRTEAMILHWAKFNAEGRSRNPKRTKAQIEADRAAEKRAATPTPSDRKRKAEPKLEPGTSVFSIKKAKLNENDTPGSSAIASEDTPQLDEPSKLNYHETAP